jgi:hypothetical protein
MNQIVINYMTGCTFPVNVFVADIYGNNRTIIGTVTSPVPPQVIFDVTIPPIFNGADKIMLILVDANGCEVFKILEATSPSFQVCLIFQDGVEFGTQGSPPLYIPDQVCAQQTATGYIINIGDTIELNSCSDTNYIINVYSAVDGWDSVISLYYEPEMNLPFVGNNLWYKTESSNILLQINDEGYVVNKFTCS